MTDESELSAPAGSGTDREQFSVGPSSSNQFENRLTKTRAYRCVEETPVCDDKRTGPVSNFCLAGTRGCQLYQSRLAIVIVVRLITVRRKRLEPRLAVVSLCLPTTALTPRADGQPMSAPRTRNPNPTPSPGAGPGPAPRSNPGPQPSSANANANAGANTAKPPPPSYPPPPQPQPQPQPIVSSSSAAASAGAGTSTGTVAALPPPAPVQFLSQLQISDGNIFYTSHRKPFTLFFDDRYELHQPPPTAGEVLHKLKLRQLGKHEHEADAHTPQEVRSVLCSLFGSAPLSALCSRERCGPGC